MLGWLTLPFLIVSITAQRYIEGVFALTWISGFCNFEKLNKKEQCNEGQLGLWDQQSFTIHGLWVDRQNTKSNFGKYNRSLIYNDEVLYQKMMEYFPPALKYSHLVDEPQFLWKHQWSKHGSDFAVAANRLWKDYRTFDNYLKRNQGLQLLYYKETIKFYESRKVRKIPTGLLTKKELADIIGVEAKSLRIVCVNKNNIRQIRVCFEVIPTGFRIKECTRPSNTCLDKMLVLKNWLKKSQKKVINSQ